MPSSALSVLVVDDDPLVREALRRRLVNWGYRVREAADAIQALEMMLKEPAAIALIDIKMPGHDGFWLAERIRQRYASAIVIVTGADDIALIEKSKTLGAVDYVLKPFNQALLKQAMDRASASLL